MKTNKYLLTIFMVLTMIGISLSLLEQWPLVVISVISIAITGIILYARTGERN